jgi:hypothetical protein
LRRHGLPEVGISDLATNLHRYRKHRDSRLSFGLPVTLSATSLTVPVEENHHPDR